MITIKKRFVSQASYSVLFLHGFTESSQCFDQAWNLHELANANILMPDLPGFGESSFDGEINILAIVDFLYDELCREHDPLLPIYIVGHSLGGAIGVKLLEKTIEAGKKCFLIDVDGLLIPEQPGASSLAFSVEYDSAAAYKDFVVRYWSARIGDDSFLRRYFENIQKTPANILHAWAKASVFFLASANLIEILSRLKDNVLYLYGEDSVNKRNNCAAKEAGVHCMEIVGAGHWPMLEKSEIFWESIMSIINKAATLCPSAVSRRPS
jgi:pimeloyl-ACP methyl ester carboxylesterase